MFVFHELGLAVEMQAEPQVAQVALEIKLLWHLHSKVLDYRCIPQGLPGYLSVFPFVML